MFYNELLVVHRDANGDSEPHSSLLRDKVACIRQFCMFLFQSTRFVLLTSLPKARFYTQ